MKVYGASGLFFSQFRWYRRSLSSCPMILKDLQNPRESLDEGFFDAFKEMVE
jgi:hypothetical protein